MPNMFGGSNTDKDYAPHMWVGDYFVSESSEVRYKNKTYRCGETSGKTIVVEGDGLSAINVKNAKVPKELRDKVIKKVKGAFKKRQDEIKRMEKLFNS